MKRSLSVLVFVTLFSYVVPPLASVTTGTIRVIVRDPDGVPLPGAQVIAETVDSLSQGTGISDDSGNVVLFGLAPSNEYVVTTTFSGYTVRNEKVLVRTGQTTTLRVRAGKIEKVRVVAQSPLVDMTSATEGLDITLDLTDSLPTGRSYTSYTQLVPGTGTASLGSGFGEDASSRSGTNYTHNGIGPGAGWSTDNLYYIEGINVTGLTGGTAAAGFNTEVIQEQKVITGGIPAEYKGTPGLISNVVTKSGGSRFSGSLNYYFQNNHLQATDRRARGLKEDFSSYHTAFTLGGPIKRDKAWFFVSYRKVNRKDYVLNAAPGGFVRTVERDEDQSYAKVTWQLTNRDRITGALLGDPWNSNGERRPQWVSGRLRTFDNGSLRYVAEYQHILDSGVLEFGFGRHAEEAHRKPVRQDEYNDIVFDTDQSFTINDEQLGGWGDFLDSEDSNEFVNGSVEWLVNSSWGRHTIKGGFEFEDRKVHDDLRYVGDAWYTSLNNDLSDFSSTCTISLFACDTDADCGGGADFCTLGPVTPAYLSTGSFNWPWPPWDVTWGPDFGAFCETGIGGTITGSGCGAPAGGFPAWAVPIDSDPMDGIITLVEAATNIEFDSMAGNPHNAINYVRSFQSGQTGTRVGSEGLSVYLQDTLQWGRWTFNVGVRAEKWEHFASTGERIFKFDWDYAPRLSVIHDIRGDGKVKLSGYYGRYYDPARNDLSVVAGTVFGPLYEGQLFVNGEWVTVIQRGGPAQPDIIAPTTQTPYTDEWQLGYELDLGRNMSLTTNVIKRETRDLLDDYDLNLYAFRNDGTTFYPPCAPWVGDPAGCASALAHPQSLFLGLDYFGFQQFPATNRVVATLAGGWRDWQGLEVIFRKRLSNGWQAIGSYVYSDAQGNSVTDSDRGYQANTGIFTDPRGPNATGTLPGTVNHRVKLLGSYQWGNGFKLGAIYRWNSGYIENKIIGPGVPVLTGFPGSTVAPYEFAGFTSNWIEPGSVGTLESPSWDVLDIRAQYNRKFGRVATEFFVDIFSVFDDQPIIRVYPGVHLNPDPGENLGDPWSWGPPRRFYLGARASF